MSTHQTHHGGSLAKSKFGFLRSWMLVVVLVGATVFVRFATFNVEGGHKGQTNDATLRHTNIVSGMGSEQAVGVATTLADLHAAKSVAMSNTDNTPLLGGEATDRESNGDDGDDGGVGDDGDDGNDSHTDTDDDHNADDHVKGGAAKDESQHLALPTKRSSSSSSSSSSSRSSKEASHTSQKTASAQEDDDTAALEARDAELKARHEEARKAAIRKKRGQVDAKPYERIPDSEVNVKYGCKFKGCPKDHPFVYYLTSHRNRADSYNRFLRTAALDLSSKVNEHPPECFCAAAADYDDVVVGAPIALAFEDWPYNKAVVSVPGPFSRAGGFQRCIDHLVTTPKEKSLVFLVDADMAIYPGFANRLLNYTRQGEWAFAPVCWSTANNETDEYDGYWRSGGTGMISFFVSEMDAWGGVLPLASKVSWGKEDHYLTKYLQKKAGLVIKRTCTPELWHYYHPKALWTSGPNGKKTTWASDEPFDPNSDWKLPLKLPDGPDVLKKRDSLNTYRCRQLDLGKMYPPDGPPGSSWRRKGGPH